MASCVRQLSQALLFNSYLVHAIVITVGLQSQRDMRFPDAVPLVDLNTVSLSLHAKETFYVINLTPKLTSALCMDYVKFKELCNACAMDVGTDSLL